MKSLYSFSSRVKSASNTKLTESFATTRIRSLSCSVQFLKSLFVSLAILCVGIGSAWGQIGLITASDGGFENATSAFANNGWTAVGTSARTWRVGTFGTAATGTKAAYWGTTTAFGGSAAAAVGHFYRDIVIPAGATNVFLNYKLRYPTVDNTYDYFYVFTTTTANTPANGVIPGAGYTQRFINTATAYAAYTAMPQVNLTALAGTTVRLVFTFKSDAFTPNSAPAVDDVTLTYVGGSACSGTPSPGNTVASASTVATGSTVNLSLSTPPPGTGLTYQWQSGPSNSGPWTNVGTSSATYVPTVSATTWYRCIVTCSGVPGTSAPVQVTAVVANNIPFSGSTTVACGTNTLIYDHAGASTNYSINANGYIVLNNNLGSTSVISLTGTIATETNYDFLTIYDGAGTGGTVIASYSGSGAIPSFTSSAGQTITVQFTSDVSGNAAGISLNAAYSGSCAVPVCSGTPTPGNTISSPSFVAAPSGNVNLSLQNVTVGTGLTYQWQSGPSNSGPWTNVGTSAATFTATVSSVTWFRCIVTCSGNSGTSAPVQVTLTACIPTMTYGCTDGDVIARVILNTLDNNSGTGCPSGTLGYSNYTSNPALTTTLLPSTSYNCIVYAGQYAANYAAWIDYNDNLIFEASERIGYTLSTVAGSGAIGVLGSSASFPVTLACTPAAGQHLLRIREVYNQTSGITITPCGNNEGLGFGEIEDYMITIAPAPACPTPGLVSSVTPTSNSVALTWATSCSSALTYDFEYGPAGFTLGSGTLVSNQTVTISAPNASFNLTGLSGGTTYNVYYRANCGGNGISAWSLASAFTTNNTASAASASPTLCINTALTAITHTTTGATGIGTPTGLPAGVTAAWVSNTITVSGTPSASGTFNYSIPLTGGVGVVNATGTIVVTPANTAGTASSSPSLCINTSLTAITHATAGATGIGTATGLPTGVTASWASNTITISGTPNASGTFSYTIPLSGGCGSVNATGTITVNALPTVTAPASETICPGASVTLSGGGASTYSWDNGITNGVAFTPNASTTYTVTGTDANGCVNIAYSAVTINALPTWGNLQWPASGAICAGGSFDIYGQVYENGVTNASYTVPGAGIVAQFGYSTSNSNPNTWTTWSNATYNSGSGNNDEFKGTFSGLSAGTYYYAFRYALNNSNCYVYGGYNTSGGGFWDGSSNVNGQLMVYQVVPLVAVTLPIACNGGVANLSVTGSGGVSPYVGETTSSVPAGNYSYTLTDANGCIGTTSYSVTEPTVLTASSTSTSILCNGGTATVTVTGNGGTGSYTGTGNFTVSAGTYTYTVTDANGCTATTSIIVTEPTLLTAGSTATSISCNGGSATVTVTGNDGTGSYTGTGDFTANAGTSSYTVIDANGCTATTSITISEPTAISVNYTATSISCTGGSAVVTITATGGTGALTGSGTFVVTAGTYTYTVTDANGCSASVSVVVTEPAVLSATANATTISCYGGSSVVTVAASGGTGVYTGTGTFTANAGASSYTVTDANGCSASASVTITQPSQLVAASTATTISCNGGSSTVTVTATGGTTPYSGIGTYTVSAGAYSYSVTDTNGCTSTTNITVSEPTVLTASSTSTSISCNGGTATVTVTGNGGTGSYTGTGDFTANAGTSSYTVIDANGCTSTTSILITEPLAVTASSSATSISCNGGSSTVTVAGNGGTGSYTGTGDFTASAGTHTYTVSDANGCTATTSITVTEPTVLTAGSTSTSISCNGGSATVTVTAAGGTGAYTGTGDFTANAGNSSYTVIDANGCTATTSIIVAEPTVLTASSSTAGISCFGGSATVVVVGSGGTGSYTGTGSFSVVAGTYSYAVTDANGCPASTGITVTQPSVLTASISSTPVLCNGGNSVITVSAAGGTGPFVGTGNYTVTAGSHSYTVTDANGCTTSTSTTISEPSALVASSSATSISCYGGTATVTVSATAGTTSYSGIGDYTVSAGPHTYTVTDANGCTVTTSITVTEPALVNAPTGNASQTFCSTLNASIVSVQVTGTAIQWYATNTGGLTLPSTTTLVDGTTYFATQTIAGCESPSYLAVTITIPVASTYYEDADADGYGNASVSQLACTQPMGFVLNNTDCDAAVATTYPGAPELCNNVDDNCSGFVDEGCPSTIAGEEPFNSLSAPSAMYSYCSSFYSTLAGSFSSTLAQSTCITGEDRWYNFTALSTGVTVFIGSNANDIVIELQDANGNMIDVENTVIGIGTEVLTKTGLTVGATYRVGVRNYNSNAQAGGQFSGCIRHLRAGGSDSGTSATWPSTIGMCNIFKAAYCGGTGVQYRYTWTGLTGIAAGQVYTRIQTSDYLTITSVTPMLPAGCMYNVLVTTIYTIPNGAGTNEVFEMPAATPTTITISANPLTSLRTSNQCSAGPRYRGAVVASLPWVCGVINWRWRFTEVNPLNLQTVGLPIEQNRGAASNYLTLTSVTALQYGKTYAVQTSPIYTYTSTNYQWGPVTYMCIIGSAGMVVDSTEDVSQDASQDSPKGLPEDLATHLSENLELSVYPNPSNGEGLTMTLSGVTSSNVQVKVYDALGRKIESKRYAVDGTLQTTLNFANELSNGLYILEVSTEDVTRSVRFMVEQ